MGLSQEKKFLQRNIFSQKGVDKFLIRDYNVLARSEYGTQKEVTQLSNSIFPEFETQLVKRGISRAKIARALGISYRAFYNKMTGRSPLGWKEASIIHDQFFPDTDKDKLFAEV